MSFIIIITLRFKFIVNEIILLLYFIIFYFILFYFLFSFILLSSFSSLLKLKIKNKVIFKN